MKELIEIYEDLYDEYGYEGANKKMKEYILNSGMDEEEAVFYLSEILIRRKVRV